MLLAEAGDCMAAKWIHPDNLKMAIPDVLAAVVDSKLMLMGAPIIALHNFCSLIDCNVEPLPYFYILVYQQYDNFI